MVSYKPLFKTMIDKDVTREQLRKEVKAGKSTFVKLYAGKHVSMELIERICLTLAVPVGAVLEFLPDKEDASPSAVVEVEADSTAKEEATK